MTRYSDFAIRNSSAIFFLPAIALLGAFTLPQAQSDVRQTVQTAFLPISWPTRVLGMALYDRLAPRSQLDLLSPDSPRSKEELLKQNTVLLSQISNLQARLDDMLARMNDFSRLGRGLEKLVSPAPVIGGPTDQRQTLMISTTGMQGLREKAPVVHPLGFVGVINNIAIGGTTARVQLLTDPSSRIEGRFVRRTPREDGGIDVVPLNIDPPLVEGTVHGMMARMMKPDSFREKLRVSDIVELDDKDFPIPELKGMTLGTVTKITVDDAGLTEVQITPTANLATLREVLVVTK